MRIGIDCHYIGSKVGGNETYTRYLVDHLAQIDRDNVYSLYVTHSNNFFNEIRQRENFRTLSIRPDISWLRVPIILPLKVMLKPVDLLHVQYIAPPLCPCKFIVTIHDISWKYHPEIIPRNVYFAQSKFVESTARRAEKIITVSETTKRDLVKFFKIPPDKIVVTYNGVKSIYRPIKDEDRINEVLKKYDIHDRYLLYTGRLEPRKNLIRLIKAFSMLKKKRSIELKLVIVGPKTWLYSEIFKMVVELGLESDIIFAGYLPEEDLPFIYNGADLFISPSVFEGFGIPPVEAMACGTPVLYSDIPAHREIIGDAGVAFNPLDINDISQTVLNALSDTALLKELSEKGIKRAGDFSWDNTAKKTLEVYQEICSFK